MDLRHRVARTLVLGPGRASARLATRRWRAPAREKVAPCEPRVNSTDGLGYSIKRNGARADRFEPVYTDGELSAAD